MVNNAAQTVNLSDNLLVKAHPIPQNAKCVFFVNQKLCLLKIFILCIWLRVLRNVFFCNIKIFENT